MKKTKTFSIAVSFVLCAGIFLPSFAFGMGVVLPPPNYKYNYAYPGSVSGSRDSNYIGGSLATAISASCAPLQESAKAGDTWIASVTGGGNGYSYIWNGSDGLTGGKSSAQIAYGTAGEKFGSVTVISSGKSVTVACNKPARIGLAPARFAVSCYPTAESALPNEDVTWVSIVNGASGAITYDWQGSENLVGDGPTAFKSYSTNGKKQAVLSVASGNDRAIAICTSPVTVGPKALPAPAKISATSKSAPVSSATLEAICTPNTTKAEVGEEVVWSAVVIGGNGSYAYEWHGDDGLSGTAASTSKKYLESGKKEAFAVITSGGKTLTKDCVAAVTVKSKRNQLLAASFFADAGFPLFGGAMLLLAVILSIFFIMKHGKESNREQESLPPSVAGVH